MRSFRFSTLLSAFVVALGALSTASSADAQTLLKEWRFATVSRASLETYAWAGWGALREQPALAYTATRLGVESDKSRLGVHSVAGVSGDIGVLFAHTGSTTEAGSRHDRFVVATPFEPLAVSARRPGYLVWSQACTNPASQVRVLVRVDGSWYASWEAFKVTRSSGAGGMANAETLSLDLAGPSGLGTTQWTEITFGDAQPILRRTMPVTTPIGTELSGIGFFILVGDAANRAVFIDDVALLGASDAAPAVVAP